MQGPTIRHYSLLTVLLGLALTLVACNEDQSNPPKSEQEANVSTAKNGTDINDPKAKSDPFAGKSFADLTDVKVVPRPLLPDSSTGSGGLALGEEFSFTSSLEMTSQVYVYAPQAAATKPHRLFGFMHGDGGGAGVNKEMAKRLAETFDVIGFAATAPDHQSWWSGKSISKTNHFNEMISKIKSKWNVDNSRLFLVGSSGGSTFITGLYLPMFSFQQPTSAFVFCGGAENLLEQYKWTDRTQTDTKVYFYRLAGDFLEDQILTAIDYYGEKGVVVGEELDTTKSGHCDFDTIKAIANAMAKG